MFRKGDATITVLIFFSCNNPLFNNEGTSGKPSALNVKML